MSYVIRRWTPISGTQTAFSSRTLDGCWAWLRRRGKGLQDRRLALGRLWIEEETRPVKVRFYDLPACEIERVYARAVAQIRARRRIHEAPHAA